jgi:hypothetical protein
MDGAHADVTQASGGFQFGKRASFGTPEAGHGRTEPASPPIAAAGAHPDGPIGIDVKRADGDDPQPVLAAKGRDGAPVVTAQRVAAVAVVRRIAGGTREPDVSIRSDGHPRHDIVRHAILGRQYLRTIFFEARQAAIRSDPEDSVAVGRDEIDPRSGQAVRFGVKRARIGEATLESGAASHPPHPIGIAKGGPVRRADAGIDETR